MSTNIPTNILTLTQTKDLYTELLAKTESQFKKIGISDAYINEFIMIVSICAANDMSIIYPFYELNKIAKHVLNTNLKTSIGIILQKYLLNKTPIEILNILKIEKKFNKDTQDFIIHKMKSIFNYNTICCKIELCDIKFVMNKKSIDIIKIMNDVDTHVLLNLYCKKHNLNEKNVKFYVDNIEMKHNEKLIDYGISYDNNIIDIIILQKC